MDRCSSRSFRAELAPRWRVHGNCGLGASKRLYIVYLFFIHLFAFRLSCVFTHGGPGEGTGFRSLNDGDAGTVRCQDHPALCGRVDNRWIGSGRFGSSRPRQRLLSEDLGELHDDMLVRKWGCVQVVVLDFCLPNEDLMRLRKLCACGQNRVGEVQFLLQKPLDPRPSTRVLCSKSRPCGSGVDAA